jgi:hypothetical protein
MASPADLSPCPTCGDRTNHGHRAAAQISCDAASYTRAAAVTWLAKTAGIEQDRAESVIAELSRAVGHTNAVRVLDYLLGSGWTVPEGWAE